ncbi:hypothetical protein CPB84DRAFT_829378 [Gymnopilus junonius]|uniref:SET domain-containing protein n=1 Tax=Gymnopilus junonius TaxID=109634 RepID=A0A9P5TFS4_GYMJU|nr:hypothetical protein CPB84DRAFT_829378 [Gymnopilus junonius]
MKRGFLNKPKAQINADKSTGASSSGSSASGVKSVEIDKGLAKKDFVLPKTGVTSDQPAKPEFASLTFVTIPPRRPGYPDDPDGHTELIFPKAGGTLNKILVTPGHPMPIPKSAQRNYVIKPIEGMGLGMFAERDIPKGEIIFAERPLLCMTLAIRNAVLDGPIISKVPPLEVQATYMNLIETRMGHALSRMSDVDQEAFMKLADCHEGEPNCGPLVGRLRTNVYASTNRIWDDLRIQKSPGATSMEKYGYEIIGKNASRINHSCTPNTGHYLDLASFSLVFLALKPIKAGEQVFLLIHRSVRSI